MWTCPVYNQQFVKTNQSLSRKDKTLQDFLNLNCMKRSAFILISLSFYFSSINAQDSMLWKFASKSAIHSSPVIDGSYIYFGSNDSNFYALDKYTGVKKWSYKTKGKIKSRPCIYKESVIFNSTDGLIYALDKKNGNLKWHFKTKGESTYDLWDYYLSSPAVYEDFVYAGSGDSCIYALEAGTGELVWRYKTMDIVHASPIIGDKKVMIGGFDGYFYALEYKTGQLVWKFNTIGDAYFPKGEVANAAVLYKNSIIFGSRDYNIYALDVNSGTGLWNMKERGSWIVATPFLFNDAIYFGTSDSHRFYCMDAAGGEIKWTLPLNMRVYGTATNHGNKVFFGCFNGKIYGADYQSGKIEFMFQTNESKSRYNTVYNADDKFKDGFTLYGNNTEEAERTIMELGAILSSPLIENNTLYFGDANGFFYAIKLK